MRLDHLLSKEKEEKFQEEGLLFIFQCTLLYIINGDIAQLARAPALQAGGQGFDSLYLHQTYTILYKVYVKKAH